MQPFCNVIHWIHSLKRQILAAPCPDSDCPLKGQYNYFLKQSKYLLLPPPSWEPDWLIHSIPQTMSPQRKKRWALHMPERLVRVGAKSEAVSYSPRGFGYNTVSLRQIRVAVLWNAATACRLLLWRACFKYRFQSLLQRIIIICILHTGNKNNWEGDIL